MRAQFRLSFTVPFDEPSMPMMVDSAARVAGAWTEAAFQARRLANMVPDWCSGIRTEITRLALSIEVVVLAEEMTWHAEGRTPESVSPKNQKANDG